MDKKEIHDSLKKSGKLALFKPHPLWKQAFDMYMSEGRGNVSLTCKSCYRKVFKWLKS